MLIVVIGGSGSGKSEYAEKRCMQLTPGKKLYIATMQSFDAESDARIARHRRLRAGKAFETLECQTHLEEANIPAGATVLLECMSNLVANEMFSPSGRGMAWRESVGILETEKTPESKMPEQGNALETNRIEWGDVSEAKKAEQEGTMEKRLAALIMQGIQRLFDIAGHVVVVTNQVFSDGISYDPETETYLRVLAAMNAEMSALADEVVEVVHGIPVFLKQ